MKRNLPDAFLPLMRIVHPSVSFQNIITHILDLCTPFFKFRNNFFTNFTMKNYAKNHFPSKSVHILHIPPVFSADSFPFSARMPLIFQKDILLFLFAPDKFVICVSFFHFFSFAEIFCKNRVSAKLTPCFFSLWNIFLISYGTNR